MTDRSKSRDALVLDALEAEFAAGGAAASSGDSRHVHGASEDSRLAELARIVGQNDRFRDLLRTPAAERRQPNPYDQAPSYDEGVHHWEGQPSQNGAAGQLNEGAAQLNAYVGAHRAQADAAAAGNWDASGAQDFGQPVHAAYAQNAAYAQDGAYAETSYAGQGYADSAPAWDGAGQARSYRMDNQGYVPAPDPLQAIEGGRLRRRGPSRKPLFAAVAVIGLCVAGSAGYYAMRGGGAGSSETPTIHADAAPVKVKPPAENAAEPITTKEIYEQLAKPSANTKVVANNEQPVDVEQTLRQQRAVAVASGRLPSEVDGESSTFGAPGVTALPTHAANRDPRSGLGEPRRVRSVSIGPDGKVRETAGQTGAASAPVAAPAPRVAKQEHRVPSTMVDATTTGSVGPTATAPAPRPQDTAKVQPRPQPAATAPVSKGGFAVQLGAPGSEEEAKKLAASLKRKYATLAGHNTAVVKAQANGRTIYRLRVPGLSRDSANNLCQQLKSVGGSCFVAQG